MFKSLVQDLVVDRQERELLQLREEIPEPQPDHCHWSRDIHPRQMKLFGGERPAQPEQIHKPHTENEETDISQQPVIPFQVAREQQRKGQSKVAEHQQQADPSPSMIHAAQEERYLFGQISGPDNQELRVRKISPDHDQGQREFPQIMQMSMGHPFPNRAVTLQHYHYSDQKRDSRKHLASDKKE